MFALFDIDFLNGRFVVDAKFIELLFNEVHPEFKSITRAKLDFVCRPLAKIFLLENLSGSENCYF